MEHLIHVIVAFVLGGFAAFIYLAVTKQLALKGK